MTTDLPELLHASDVETWSDEVEVSGDRLDGLLAHVTPLNRWVLFR